jgi:hypothetical protein
LYWKADKRPRNEAIPKNVLSEILITPSQTKSQRQIQLIHLR